MDSITIYLPDSVLEDLRRKAEEEGKSPEELVTEAVLKWLSIEDPQVRVELHLKLCEKYLRESEELLAKQDYVQASEKAWGAATQVIKALAAKEGKELKSHGEMHKYLASLVEKTGDRELRRMWSTAGELHRNFYEMWLPPELVKGYVEDIKEFVSRVRKLIQN